ncbi:MAG: DUF202 domain-containing protein [bacterium]|nr:DUF202 domain-containing protein [bacterium]
MYPTAEPRASDALANERTFLAYVRTALAMIGFGFVIARFGLFVEEIAAVAHLRVSSPHLSTAFGIAMAFFGVAVACVGTWRYVATDRELRTGAFRALPSALAYAFSVGIIAIGLLVALLLIAYR